MRTHESPAQRLSVYCSKGTVNALRFSSDCDRITGHVEHALEFLGVCDTVRHNIFDAIVRRRSFSDGFRYDPDGDLAGKDRVVVYVTMLNPNIEAYVAKTSGELQEFVGVFPDVNDGVGESGGDPDAVLPWRKSA